MKNVHIGTMGWSYNFWKNTFYPKDLNSKEFLKYYSSKFSTVEVNNTFYRTPNKETVLSWKEQTPTDFIFSIKFPRKITHFKMLKDTEEDTDFFLKTIKPLNQKLGPLLIQLPNNFAEKKLPTLLEYLDNLPKNHKYALEIRNKTLFTKKLILNLTENNIALVWLDHPYFPLYEENTADLIYIRWQGNRKKVTGTTGKTEIEQTKHIKTWAKKITNYTLKSNSIFGYFSKFHSGNPIKDATEIKELINK